MRKPILVYQICFNEQDITPGMFFLYDFKLAQKYAKAIMKKKKVYTWIKVQFDYYKPSRKIRKECNKWCKKLIKDWEATYNEE